MHHIVKRYLKDVKNVTNKSEKNIVRLIKKEDTSEPINQNLE